MKDFDNYDFSQDSSDEDFQCFLKDALAGDGYEYGRVGEIYFQGSHGVEEDYRKARYWLTKGAFLDRRDPARLLGHCYRKGYFGKVDYGRAIFWYEIAAMHGVTYDSNVLKEVKEEAARAGYVAEPVWGDLNFSSYKNNKQFRQLWARAIDGREADARCEFGDFFVTQKDWEKAAFFYKMAAGSDIVLAMLSLGDCYYNGLGVGQDEEIAAYWWTKAADKGNDMARERLNELSDAAAKPKPYGLDTPPAKEMIEHCLALGTDDPEFEFVKKQATEGNIAAEYIIATAYYNMKDADYRRAAFWFKLAAEQGNSNAQLWLGECYYLGRGVPENDAEANKWLRKAAEHGNERARERLNQINAPESKPASSGFYRCRKCLHQGQMTLPGSCPFCSQWLNYGEGGWAQ